MGNFPDTQACGKFPKNPGIWEILKITQIHHHQIPTGIWDSKDFLKNQAFGKFSRYPGIWEILQILHHQIPTGIWEAEEIPKYPDIEKFPKS